MTEKLELFWPVKPAKINQTFGVNGWYYRKNGFDLAGHNGIDFAAAHGQPVRAAHDGVVIYSGEDDRGGVGVEIVTMEAMNIGDVYSYGKTIYFHFMREGKRAAAGDVVKVGDIIGYADSTGFSTGDHLHFGLKRVVPDIQSMNYKTLDPDNGYLGAIDPMPYFGKFAAEDAVKAKSILEKIRDTLSAVVDLYKKIIR